MIFSLLFSTAFSLFCTSASDSYNLHIKVHGIKHEQGTIHICLMTANEKFLSECALSQSSVIDSDQVKITLEEIPPNTYCVSLFQDLDDDQKLATDGLFGLPSEPFGFSNNPSAIFGPPSFKKCSFVLGRDTELAIKLK